MPLRGGLTPIAGFAPADRARARCYPDSGDACPTRGTPVVKRLVLFTLAVLLLIATGVFALQFQRRGFAARDYDPAPPPGANEKTEFAFARLHFHSPFERGMRGWWA